MNIKAKQSILDKIEIASPCTVSWENMEGDATVRHCSQCQLSVYNISDMSKKEAEKLIQENEGRVCVRLYRRFDGTVITNDCPVGLRKLRQSLNIAVRAAATVLSFFLGISGVQAQDNKVSKDKTQSSSSSQKPDNNQQAKSNTATTSNKKALESPHLNGAPMMGNICPVRKTPVLDAASKAPTEIKPDAFTKKDSAHAKHLQSQPGKN